jgi:hypothetical protein
MSVREALLAVSPLVMVSPGGMEVAEVIYDVS